MSEKEYREIDEEDEDLVEDLKEPFDPKLIEVVPEQKSLDTIFSRIKHKEIDLNTKFQRNLNLWSSTIMSRLMESVMVRFPLPAFYFDASDDDRWLVVDGLQRLYTFKRFVIDCDKRYRDHPDDKPLKLTGMEFLVDYEGMTFKELPHTMKRRIKESQITTYLIKPGTPDSVKYSIFYRINTGGLTLNPQEIRHALNQDGHANTFLETISELQLFKDIVKVSPKRMHDKELVLRHMAFRLTPYTAYKPTMKSFLNETMKKLNTVSPKELEKLEQQFISSLVLSRELFGSHVFSKSLNNPMETAKLNRGLFEALTVLFAQLSEEKKSVLRQFKQRFKERFSELLSDRYFDRVISSNTTNSTAVKQRFVSINDLILNIERNN
jgi:hypothetical protein